MKFLELFKSTPAVIEDKKDTSEGEYIAFEEEIKESDVLEGVVIDQRPTLEQELDQLINKIGDYKLRKLINGKFIVENVRTGYALDMKSTKNFEWPRGDTYYGDCMVSDLHKMQKKVLDKLANLGY